jgi:hypothetical protein
VPRQAMPTRQLPDREVFRIPHQPSGQTPLGNNGPTDRTSRSWAPRWKMAAPRARIAAAISLSAGPLSASGKYSTPPGCPRSSTRSRQQRWR